MAGKIWFITGTSRGFGRIWAEAALMRGDKVAATARTLENIADLKEKYGANVLTLELDVTRPDQVKTAVTQAHDHFGRLDIVLNNAGYSLVGTIEEASADEVRALYQDAEKVTPPAVTLKTIKASFCFKVMRGIDTQQSAIFSYVSPEERVPVDHPLRPIRKMVDVALKSLSPSFNKMYTNFGRPSIAPEKLLRALLLQVLYSIRSERMLMEQLEYNLLFRWFTGLNMDEPVWVPTVFSKNRDRLLEGDIAQKFFAQVLEQAREEKLTSDEHFSVDGTLLEAWASHKSFQRKDEPKQPPDDNDPGNPSVNFRGEERRNDTHESTTDPEARLAKKSGGSEAKLAYCGNVLIENRNGLVVDVELLSPSGTAEREAAATMVERVENTQRITIAADKGYDTKDFVAKLRKLNATPHVAQNEKRPGGSALDERTTRHAGYQVSQRKRKRIEEVFGWMKTVGMLRKTRHRGVSKVGWVFAFTAAAYNLVRMRNLLSTAVQSA